jgi:predicted helicase
MYGGMNKRDTEKASVLLRESSSYIIVWTSDMMWRWVDIPSIDTIFFYCALKFKWTIVQAVGRCLRKTEDDKAPVVVDWCDVPLLNKQMRERVKAYRLEYWKDVLISKIKI